MLDLDSISIILQDIRDRSGGEYRRMTLSDRLLCISVMRELKSQIDAMLEECYPIICEWAELDLQEETLKAKEPEFDFIKRFIERG